jgi:hypothetical protein
MRSSREQRAARKRSPSVTSEPLKRFAETTGRMAARVPSACFTQYFLSQYHRSVYLHSVTSRASYRGMDVSEAKRLRALEVSATNYEINSRRQIAGIPLRFSREAYRRSV